jgi:tRNA G10  N-methylase Trm11
MTAMLLSARLPRMKYFFVLGNNPALSAAELFAVLKVEESAVVAASPELLVLELETAPDSEKLMRQLGGTVKFGVIEAEVTDATPDKIEEAIAALPHFNTMEIHTSRIVFGLSVYGLTADACANRRLPSQLKQVGLNLKKRFAENGASVRWVPNVDGPSLSSAAVSHNKLAQDGTEIVVAEKSGLALVGRTLAVQPLDDFSARDFGRPGRDTVQGMLPPKLAIMMLNVAGTVAGTTIADPFCGSGTVVTEALLLGAAKVFGSDKNSSAIKDTTTNLVWAEGHGLKDATTRALTKIADARNVTEWIPNSSVDLVVTEPYLGPPRRGRESRSELQRMLLELQHLYGDALANWKNILKPGGSVVMVLPIFRIAPTKDMPAEAHSVDAKKLTKEGFVQVPLLSPSLVGRVNAKPGKNGGLVYGRADQWVWREIVKWVKQ